MEEDLEMEEINWMMRIPWYIVIGALVCAYWQKSNKDVPFGKRYILKEAYWKWYILRTYPRDEEHGHEMTALEALRWAIDNSSPGPVTPTEITEASLAKYRRALLEFHRKSKRRRYEMQQAAADQHPRAL